MLLELIQDGFFKLITLRAALAAILAFLMCILLGPRIIAFLKSKKIGEKVEKKDSEKLDTILSHKRGTPTMGGIFIITSIVFGILICGNFNNPANYTLLFVVISLCILGAYDDYLKLTGKNKKGLKLHIKLLCQIAIGIIAGVWITLILMHKDFYVSTNLYIPIFSNIKIPLDTFYPFFVMFVIVACSNAVNITDGLDGLAAGCLAMATLAYAIIAYIVGRVDFTEYLEIPYVRTSAEVTVFSASMLGACIGFLWFNCYPSQIFMGDSGSLPLGGALGLIACITKQELLIFLVGGIFVIEILSTLIQVISFRLFGKRVFLIAPLHHHYQFKNIQEPKITIRFWIVAAILALASLAILKLKY